MNIEEPVWLDEHKATAILRRPVRTLRQWRYMKCGPVYYKTNGGRIEYLESDLIDFILQSRVEPKAANAQEAQA